MIRIHLVHGTARDASVDTWDAHDRLEATARLAAIFVRYPDAWVENVVPRNIGGLQSVDDAQLYQLRTLAP